MALALAAFRKFGRLLRPRQSAPGFEILDSTQPIEEETFSWYDPTNYYPVRIGQVFNSRYQVIGKLGYGGYSTVWLCRDLLQHRYIALKVCTSNAPAVNREVAISNHLNALKSNNFGSKLVRTALDQFVVTNSNETYQCLVYKPMATTMTTFRQRFPNDRLPESLLKVAVIHLLITIGFLHEEAKVIHTDIQEENILIEMDDEEALEAFEKAEQTNPSPRKIDGDRIIHTSRDLFPKKYGRPILCDFGEARFKQSSCDDDIMPFQYRAPEVILNTSWTEKVDIWSVGVMIWDLFEDKNMFKTRGPNNEQTNLCHLASMVAVLGLPPKDFLQQSTTYVPWKYFDSEGNWKGTIEIPNESLEDFEENLEGENKAQFLRFMRRMLKWKPEERSSAEELLQDPWLQE